MISWDCGRSESTAQRRGCGLPCAHTVFAREPAVPVGHGKGTLACITADFLGRTRGEVGDGAGSQSPWEDLRRSYTGGSRHSWEIQSRVTGSSSETLGFQILMKIKSARVELTESTPKSPKSPPWLIFILVTQPIPHPCPTCCPHVCVAISPSALWAGVGLCPETVQPENNACPWTESAESSRNLHYQGDLRKRDSITWDFTLLTPAWKCQGAPRKQEEHTQRVLLSKAGDIHPSFLFSPGLSQPGPSCLLISLPAGFAVPEF